MVKIASRLFYMASSLLGLLAFNTVGYAFAAVAVPLPDTLSQCGKATITAVSDGETLKTADGTSIRLAALKAPELWPEGAAYNSWPHAEWAKTIVERLTLGETVQLYCEGEATSFDNQKIVHIELPNGNWLQQMLVEQGTAFVFPLRDHISGLTALYAAEDKARMQKLGIWQTTMVLPAEDNAGNKSIRTGWFQVIRGAVLDTARVRRQVFLNFGVDWRKDFTVEIPASAMRAFKKADVDPLSFQTQQIEVRGWVTWKGGPHIMLEGPGQIRVIDP